jgi:hypothetical protein
LPPKKYKVKWFKKKNRVLPEEHVCRNCGAQTVGKYCHNCGQNIFTGSEQPIFHLFGQMLENAFALDAKAPRTLFFLMFRPGFLSAEYRAGRINRYVHPVKLFWMSTLIFFALLIFQITNSKNNDKDIISVKSNETVQSNDTVQSNETAQQRNINFSFSSSKTSSLSINMDDPETIKQKSDETMNILINALSKYAPYITFLFIPIFALMLVLFFWRKKYYYVSHLTFTVHFHTFLWIFWSLLMLINILTHNWEFPDWLATLLFFIPGIYFAVALHRYYQTKTRWQAIWKAILISFFYFVLILTVTVFLLLWMLKKTEIFSDSL